MKRLMLVGTERFPNSERQSHGDKAMTGESALLGLDTDSILRFLRAKVDAYVTAFRTLIHGQID